MFGFIATLYVEVSYVSLLVIPLQIEPSIVNIIVGEWLGWVHSLMVMLTYGHVVLWAHGHVVDRSHPVYRANGRIKWKTHRCASWP